MLRIGHCYTMSAMKHASGDRSWSTDLWEVLAFNETHVVIKNAAPRYRTSFGVQPMTVQIALFDWTPAGDLLKALADHALAL